MSVKAYTAGAMTGLSGAELVARSRRASQILRAYGVVPLDPVAVEGVDPNKPVIMTDDETMERYWRRDKELIREAHVLIDLTPHMKSEGVLHEIGYARYHLWMPIIRVYENGELPRNAIPKLEDDVVVQTLEEAGRIVRERWGTPWKRFQWRVALYLRCWPRSAYQKLLKWF